MVEKHHADDQAHVRLRAEPARRHGPVSVHHPWSKILVKILVKYWSNTSQILKRSKGTRQRDVHKDAAYHRGLKNHTHTHTHARARTHTHTHTHP